MHNPIGLCDLLNTKMVGHFKPEGLYVNTSWLVFGSLDGSLLG